MLKNKTIFIEFNSKKGEKVTINNLEIQREKLRKLKEYMPQNKISNH